MIKFKNTNIIYNFSYVESFVRKVLVRNIKRIDRRDNGFTLVL